jgi:hypothetical protein
MSAGLDQAGRGPGSPGCGAERRAPYGPVRAAARGHGSSSGTGVTNSQHEFRRPSRSHSDLGPGPARSGPARPAGSCRASLAAETIMILHKHQWCWRAVFDSSFHFKILTPGPRPKLEPPSESDQPPQLEDPSSPPPRTVSPLAVEAVEMQQAIDSLPLQRRSQRPDRAPEAAGPAGGPPARRRRKIGANHH